MTHRFAALASRSFSLSGPLSFLVLLGCLWYSFAGAFVAPYSGILFNSDWIIEAVRSCVPQAPNCEAEANSPHRHGKIIRIGNLPFSEFVRDRTHVAFEGYGPGDKVNLEVLNDGELRQIDWVMPDPTLGDRLFYFENAVTYLPFWLAGTVALFLLRPHDRLWRLLILFNYVTALWIAAGVVSFQQVAASSLVLHALTWILAPTYLYLHLSVPSPLWPGVQKLTRWAFGGAFLFALLELFQLLPREAYAVPVLIAFAGSLAILVIRLRIKSTESDLVALRLMLIGIALSFSPGVLLYLIPAVFGTVNNIGLAPNIAVLAIPILPFSYIYAFYRHRLGALEFRANRLLSVYSFGLIYATIFVLAFSIGGLWLNLPAQSLGFGLLVSSVFVVIAIPLGTRYQRMVDRLLYGAKFDPEEIVRQFSNRIPTALDKESLVHLITRDLTPSLLIRESALYLMRDPLPVLFYADPVALDLPVRNRRSLEELSNQDGRYRIAEDLGSGEFSWVRLAINLKAGNERVGVWLLGRRDPDDFFPQRDIALLKSLANMIAPVLENIRLFDEARTSARQFALLYDAGLALNSVLKLRPQLEYLSELAMKTLHAERAALFSFDIARNEMLFEFGIGFKGSTLQKLSHWRFPAGGYGSLVSWVAQNRIPVNVPDVLSNPMWTNIDTSIRSGIWVPVQRGAELQGVMAVYSTRLNAFTDHDERLLNLFANQAAVALENARLFEAEQTRREELSGLYDLSRALADAAFDFEAILNLIARRAVETIHVTFSRVMLLEGDEFVARAAHPVRHIDFDLHLGRREPAAAHPLFQRVLREGRVAIVNLQSSELSPFECETIFLGVAQTVCLVPLTTGDHGMGLLVLGESRRREREPFTAEKLSLARSIGDLTISALHHAELYSELEKAYLQTVLTLAQAVDAKDTYTADHASNLAEMALAVGQVLGLSPRELDDLRYGAILHDIGKIGIRDSILLKPGLLTPEEREEMRQHPVIGARILAPVPRLANAARIVRHHHEWYDGRGYPDHLAGQDIPLGARILSVADAFSAITDERVYKAARSRAEALAELCNNSGTQFEPAIVDIFIRLLDHDAH